MSNKSTNSNNRNEAKKATRARILDAAFRVFGEKGFGVPTAELAREAGVAHGSVFVHFGTRDELLAAAVAEFGERTARRIHEKALGPEPDLRRALEAHLSVIAEAEDFYVRLATEAASLPLPAKNALVLVQSAIAFHFMPGLEAAAAKGGKRLDPALAFNAWLGLVHHYLANRDLFAPGASLVRKRGGELIDFYIALTAKE